jgi:glycosyltransferase involved in cell wall biosynthesis
VSARNVVLVLPDPPLPFGNAAGRWFYALLRGLTERGHRVTTFAVCRSAFDRSATEDMYRGGDYDLRLYTHPTRSGIARKLESLRRPYGYVFSPELERDLGERLAEGYDVLHLEQLWTGWTGWEHAERALLNIHYLFELDLASAPIRSPKDAVLRVATRSAERRLLRHYPTISTLTPRLTARVEQIAPRATVRTVPLGLDLANYPFHPDGTVHERPIVGLIGSFDWFPTRSAGDRLITRIWPEIRRHVPDARLLLVGRDARSAMARHLPMRNVEVYENVPDILPYFDATDVMLYTPASGSGMKVKVLEAFALGVPVVTTGEGVEGVPAEDGVHAGVADDDAGLVERTVRLLTDAAHYRAIRGEARRLVETHCAPPRSLDLVEACYDAVGSRAP